VRVDELRTLEKARAQRAEHDRVLARRNRLAEEMKGMAESIMNTADIVREIDECEREIGRINATSALQLGYIPLVLSGAAPAIRALFQDVVVWDAFISVAAFQQPPALCVRADARDALQRPS
jgi:hypothetical protein